MNYWDIAKRSIEHFSVENSQYTSQGANRSFALSGNFSDNLVFVKQQEYAAKFRINFNNTRGCKVYIGNQIGGDISINFNGDNSTVYIGDNCDLNQLELRSRQAQDFIAIGEEVSVAGRNVWVSGYGAGSHTPAIIVGDDCMFSYDIVIRNSDAHPIFDSDTDSQINEPHGAVHIEPHVWIGERSNILKDTTVGACSIIALGSTVTRDAPRFSVVRGTPAEAAVQESSYWARDYSEFAINQAKYYSKKYRAVEQT